MKTVWYALLLMVLVAQGLVYSAGRWEGQHVCQTHGPTCSNASCWGSNSTNGSSSSDVDWSDPVQVGKAYNEAAQKGIQKWEDSRKKPSSSSSRYSTGCPHCNGAGCGACTGGYSDSSSKCISCGADWTHGIWHYDHCPTQREARIVEQYRLEQLQKQRMLEEAEQQRLKDLRELEQQEREAFAQGGYFSSEELSTLSAAFYGDMSRYDEGFTIEPQEAEVLRYKEFVGDPGRDNMRYVIEEGGIPNILPPGQITDMPIYKRREDGILVRQVLGKPVNGIIPRPKDFGVDDTSQRAWMLKQQYGSREMTFAEFKADKYYDNIDDRDWAMTHTLETMNQLQKEGKIRISVTEQNAVESIMRSRLEGSPVDIPWHAVNKTKIKLVMDAAQAKQKSSVASPELELPSTQEIEKIINVDR